jgi:hypothetical protein
MKLFGTNRYCFMTAIGVIFESERRAKCQIFYLVQLKFCHGLALMGHQILLGLPIIIHKTHINDMKMFGTNRYCFMASNRVNFGSERRAKCQTFDLVQLKFCHGLALMGHQLLLGLPIIIH